MSLNRVVVYAWLLVPLFNIGTIMAQSLADEFFIKKNFDDAYQEYLQIPESELSNEIRYKIAVCILNGNELSKAQAIPVLNKYLELKPNDGNAHYLLGRAYAYEKEFNLAEKEFTFCLTAAEISAENKIDAGHQLEYVQSARVIIPYEADVKLEKLPVLVNSGFDDYWPFTDAAESIVYFNSKRNDGSTELPNGQFTSNIYFSKVDNGDFTQAKLVEGNINQKNTNEEIVGLSNDGKKAILCIEDNSGNIDLKIADMDNGKITAYEKLPKGINSKYHEIAATFGVTTNEIYFASDRPGGFGGIDLYVVRKDFKGKWTKPQNLGPEINSIYDEDFPNLSHDGKLLFFSSKGHSSIGGYDIFKASWDDNAKRYIKPINVGYPVNTMFDDMNLNFSGNERYGYVSRRCEKTQYDIFRITFEDIEPELSIITGKIETGKTENELLNGLIMVVENIQSGEISGEYLPNPNTMRYVMALQPGSYKVSIEIEGYEPYEEQIEIKGKSAFVPEIEKNFNLKRQ